MEEPTEKGKRVEHIHAQKRRESELQKIHDRLQHTSHSTGFSHKFLQTWYPDLQSCLGRTLSSHVGILRVDAMFFGGSREHLWANRFCHLRRELFDKFLEPRWEVGICALDLIFGVCEKGFEVTIGRRYAVCEVF